MSIDTILRQLSVWQPSLQGLEKTSLPSWLKATSWNGPTKEASTGLHVSTILNRHTKKHRQKKKTFQQNRQTQFPREINRQTFPMRQPFLQETTRTFQAERFRSAGDVSLYARDGKMLGSHRNSSISYIGIPQNRTKLWLTRRPL